MAEGDVWQPQKHTWASSGSVDRNKKPIADVLKSFIEAENHAVMLVLEIASGFGDHISTFARDHPNVKFQPTEAQSECIAALSKLQCDNIFAPLKLNVLDERDWEAIRSRDQVYDGIININMIHISPAASTEALFAGAASVLADRAFMLLYGAYLTDDGEFASDGDRDFDASLRMRDASFGLRNPLEVDAIAEKYGFLLIDSKLMALNNRIFIWRFHRK